MSATRRAMLGTAAVGMVILLVEQLIEKALALVDRVYGLARGRVVLQAARGG